jgi:hypothetical protein
MNIPNIHIYQGLQNTVRPAGENNAATTNRPLSVGITNNSGSLSGVPKATGNQLLGITALINNLQTHVESNLNIVRDPPFFPIATYQRADLIKRIRIIEEEVQRSSLDNGLRPEFTPSELKAQASDKEISAALDKLFALRNRLTGNEPLPSAENAEPGSILAVEI